MCFSQNASSSVLVRSPSLAHCRLRSLSGFFSVWNKPPTLPQSHQRSYLPPAFLDCICLSPLGIQFPPPTLSPPIQGPFLSVPPWSWSPSVRISRSFLTTVNYPWVSFFFLTRISISFYFSLSQRPLEPPGHPPHSPGHSQKNCKLFPPLTVRFPERIWHRLPPLRGRFAVMFFPSENFGGVGAFESFFSDS